MLDHDFWRLYIDKLRIMLKLLEVWGSQLLRHWDTNAHAVQE